ncbi:MAG: prolipoprotein diacylglyceryl transferase [Planctomycetota bacterium]
MQDVLFRIPFLDLPIYGYGLMLVLGVFSAMGLSKWLAPKVGIDPDFFQNAALLAVFSGIVGARLSHIFENLDKFTDPTRSFGANFFDAINLTSGGLTFFGGLIFAALVTIAYAVWKKVPLKLGMDVAAPCIVLGLAFGRIGCLLHGCCWGGVCDLPWAIEFPYGSPAHMDHVEAGLVAPPGPQLAALEAINPAAAERLKADFHSLPVHPTQLYSSANAFFLTAVLIAFFHVPHQAGRGLALMMILLGSSRFLLETIRREPTVIGSFSFSMVVGLLLAAAGVVLWFLMPKLGPTTTVDVTANPPDVEPKPAPATVPA